MTLKDFTKNDESIEISTLGDETRIGGFKQVSAKEIIEFNIGGDIKLLPSSQYNNGWTTRNFKNEEYIHDGKVITLGKLRNANIKYYEGKFISSQNHIITVRNENKLLPKFVYYLIESNLDKFYPKKSDMNLFSIESYKKTKIIIPPMNVQQEVVKYLDKYSTLKDELLTNINLEIEMREKEKVFIINSLFENLDCERMKIGEIATGITRGMGIKKDDVEPEDSTEKNKFPCIRYAEIFKSNGFIIDNCNNYVDIKKVKYEKYAEKGDILFALTGESHDTIGKSVAYMGDRKILVGSDIAILRHKQNPEYLAFALSTKNAQKQKSNTSTKGSVAHIKIKDIENIEIPVPSLEEQNKIATKLKNLTADNKELIRLLREQARMHDQKYKHYRSVLLEQDIIKGLEEKTK